MPNWCLHSQWCSSSLIIPGPFLCYKGDPFKIRTNVMSAPVASDLFDPSPGLVWICHLTKQCYGSLQRASIPAPSAARGSITGQGLSRRRAEKKAWQNHSPFNPPHYLGRLCWVVAVTSQLLLAPESSAVLLRTRTNHAVMQLARWALRRLLKF